MINNSKVIALSLMTAIIVFAVVTTTIITITPTGETTNMQDAYAATSNPCKTCTRNDNVNTDATIPVN